MTATRFLQTTSTPWPVVKWNSTWRYLRRPRPRIFPTRTTASTTTYSIQTTEKQTTSTSSTTVTTPTTSTTSFQWHSTSTRQPLIYYTNSTTTSPTTTTTTTNSSSTAKTTLPLPTPWYPPAGPSDWWYRKWYTTQTIKSSSSSTTTTTTPQTTTTVTTNPVTSITSSTTIETNTTVITTAIQENTTSLDWLQWPILEFTSTAKGHSDYDEEYSDWPDYFATTKIPLEQTSDSLLFFPAGRPRKKFQQLNFFPTDFNDQFINPLLTNPTPLMPTYSTAQFADRLSKSQSADARSTGKIETLRNFLITSLS